MNAPTIQEFKQDIKTLKLPNVLKRIYPEFYEYLLQKYPDSKKITESVYCYFHNLDSIPVCQRCGNLVKFINFTEGYRTYCGRYCMSLDTRSKAESTKRERYGGNGVSEEIVAKRKSTNLERYGVEHPMQSVEIRNKAVSTNLERYGVETPCQSPEIREKVERTMLQRHGVKHALQKLEFLEKSKQTCKEHYGVVFPGQSQEIHERQERTMQQKYGGMGAASEEIKKKIKETNQQKYGTDWGIGTEKIREKVKETVNRRYGVDNVFASDEIKKKIIDTNMRKYGITNSGGLFNKSFITTSKVSQKFFDQLDEIIKKLRPDFHTRYFSKNGEYRFVYDDHAILFDYYIEELKLDIEFNGDAFHANPSKYKSSDHPIFFSNVITASDIWEKERVRDERIKAAGYNLIKIWESEYKKLKSKKQIKTWFLKQLEQLNIDITK